ncbi:MAG: Peptidase S51 dipeptidase E [uncultured bacterium]|nr:MAG: Peptidase S51 dipeptidase E [uncultured bacterium]
MKLLLTSAGFRNKEVEVRFIELLNKPVEEINLIFIPTASRFEDELKYVEISRQELIQLGIKNIKTLQLDHQITKDEIDKADVIYVCGGNTFYLIQQIRQSGFDKLLKSFQGLYVGVSAGSIVVGPNVEVSGPWDENDINLTDTTGMNIVNVALIPHYQRKEKSIVDDLKAKANYEIIELTDNQAVLVVDGEKKVIGQP